MTIDPDLPVESIRNKKFEDGGTGLLSRYTGHMKEVFRVYESKRAKIDKETMYIFLVGNAENTRKEGYMPPKKNCGFLFIDQVQATDNFHKVLAHELGHGAFHLKHPWSEKYIPEGSQQYNNLMDYTRNGTRLHKYQWDLLHNPAPMLGLFQDEKEGASIVDNVTSIIELIRKAYQVNGLCEIPFYSSSTTLTNIHNVHSDKIIEDEIAKKFFGLKVKLEFNTEYIDRRICTFHFKDLDPIEAKSLPTEIEYLSVLTFKYPNETKTILNIYGSTNNPNLLREYVLGDIEKDCNQILVDISSKIKSNQSVDLHLLSSSCAKEIPLELRKDLIKYILNRWIVSDKYEHAILVLIDQIKGEDVDDFVEFIRKEKIGNKFIYESLMSAFNNLTNQRYYPALIQSFTRLLLKTTKYSNRNQEDELKLKEVTLLGRKPWINFSEIPELEYRYDKKPKVNSNGEIEVAYKVRLLEDITIRDITSFEGASFNFKVVEGKSVNKEYIWVTKDLSFTYDPLELVVLSNFSETSNVDQILLEKTSKGVIIPAVLLLYNEDKILQQNIERGVYLSLDALSVFFSGGTLVYIKVAGTSISKMKRFLLFLELANGLINASINISELEFDPNIQHLLGWYNLSTAGINLAYATKNIQWLRKANGEVLKGCENISETFVKRMSKYDEPTRILFFKDFKDNKNFLAQIDNLSDAEFDNLVNSYNWKLADDVRKQAVLARIAKGEAKVARTIEELAPNGKIPKNSEFNKWFDELSEEELSSVWNNDKLRNQIEVEIRKPGELHEWCMVCEVEQFKKWGVKMEDIKNFRTKTTELVGINPYDGTPFAHSIINSEGRVVAGPSSKTFHNELQALIGSSNSLVEFNNGLIKLIEKWKIDPSLLPPFIK